MMMMPVMTLSSVLVLRGAACDRQRGSAPSLGAQVPRARHRGPSAGGTVVTT